jgi:hypothetical protein
VLVENNTNMCDSKSNGPQPKTMNYLWALPQSSSKMLLTFFSLFVDGARTADWCKIHDQTRNGSIIFTIINNRLSELPGMMEGDHI